MRQEEGTLVDRRGFLSTATLAIGGSMVVSTAPALADTGHGRPDGLPVRDAGKGGHVERLAFVGETLVAIGLDAGNVPAIWLTDNLRDWRRSDVQGLGPSSALWCLGGSAPDLIAVGRGRHGGVMSWTSTDGEEWIPSGRTSQPSDNEDLSVRDVSLAGTPFAIGLVESKADPSSESATEIAAWTIVGSRWERMDGFAPDFGHLRSVAGIAEIEVGRCLVVASDHNGGVVLTSRDRESWSAAPLGDQSDLNPRAVAVRDSRVLVASEHTSDYQASLGSSLNGEDWEFQPLPRRVGMVVDLVANDDQIVLLAVDWEGVAVMYSSSDGSAWDALT